MRGPWRSRDRLLLWPARRASWRGVCSAAARSAARHQRPHPLPTRPACAPPAPRRTASGPRPRLSSDWCYTIGAHWQCRNTLRELLHFSFEGSYFVSGRCVHAVCSDGSAALVCTRTLTPLQEWRWAEWGAEPAAAAVFDPQHYVQPAVSAHYAAT